MVYVSEELTEDYVLGLIYEASRKENREIEEYIIGFMMKTGLTIEELKENYILDRSLPEIDFGPDENDIVRNDYVYSWTTHYRLRLKTPEEKTDDNRS